jgi:alpha-L-fucosidase 2
VASTLTGLTEQFQAYPTGFAKFGPSEPYVEQIGVLATALQESLVQNYDGLLRIAPAWPAGWDVDGTVFTQGRSKVDVQIRRGVPVTVAIEAGSAMALRVRNPWPGQPVEVVTGTGKRVLGPTRADEFTLDVRAGQAYLVQPLSAPTNRLPFAPVTGSPATTAKVLGSRTIGLH